MGSNMSPARVPHAALLREIAVLAEADPRSVRRCLEGKPVRVLTARRIIRVLQNYGLQVPAPVATAASPDERNPTR
jgi:hypothetical protein